jgi:hypothetical protein
MLVDGYRADGDVELRDIDCVRDLPDGEVDGSIDIRSIRPRMRSRSLSACPFALAARSCSIWLRS